MDEKQKRELKILLRSRRRAKRMLAKRNILDRERKERLNRRERNLLLKNQYSQRLNELANESTILPMLEAAEQYLGACLTRTVSYYLYFGFGLLALQQTEEVAQESQLRAAYLDLLLTWNSGNQVNETEIRVHMNGLITFHNSLIPIFRFVWRNHPEVLQRMLDSALRNPRIKPLASVTRG